jgi:hypothetical protein
MDCFAQFSIIDRHELLFFHLEESHKLSCFFIVFVVYVAFLPNKKMLETGWYKIYIVALCWVGVTFFTHR